MQIGDKYICICRPHYGINFKFHIVGNIYKIVSIMTESKAASISVEPDSFFLSYTLTLKEFNRHFKPCKKILLIRDWLNQETSHQLP